MELRQRLLESASDKLKEQLYTNLLNYKLEVGSTLYNAKSNRSCEVTEVLENGEFLGKYENYPIDTHNIKDFIFDSKLNSVGANPFVEPSKIKIIAYSLESVFRTLGLNKKLTYTNEPLYVNFDPYFIEPDGSKTHYQRGNVWSLKQKQELINTVYKGMECGRVIIHAHDYDYAESMHKKGYTDFAIHDVVDGKQRLTALMDFYQNKYPDFYGNYYGDLSYNAKRKFENYQGLIYGMICSYTKEPLSKKEILSVFLNNVVGGTPLDENHLKYVNTLLQNS